MKYYATITTRHGQFEVGGTKAEVSRDLKAMKCSGRLDGSECINIYGVDLATGSRIPVDIYDENDIMGG